VTRRFRFPLRTEKWPWVPTKRWIVFWIVLAVVTSIFVCTRRVPDPYGRGEPPEALGVTVTSCRWDPAAGSLQADVGIEVLDPAHDLVADLSDRLRVSSLGVSYDPKPGQRVDVSNAWRPGSEPLSVAIELHGLERRPVAVRLFVTELMVDQLFSIQAQGWRGLSGHAAETPFGHLEIQDAWVEGSGLSMAYLLETDWLGGSLQVGGPALMELRGPAGRLAGIPGSTRHDRDLFYQEIRFETLGNPGWVGTGPVSIVAARWVVEAASDLRFETEGTCHSE
jgi:hypothetical protein